MVTIRPLRRARISALAASLPIPFALTCAGLGLAWPNGPRCPRHNEPLDVFGICDLCLRGEADAYAPLVPPSLSDAEEEEEEEIIRRNDALLALQEAQRRNDRLSQDCPWLQFEVEDDAFC